MYGRERVCIAYAYTYGYIEAPKGYHALLVCVSERGNRHCTRWDPKIHARFPRFFGDDKRVERWCYINNELFAVRVEIARESPSIFVHGMPSLSYRLVYEEFYRQFTLVEGSKN